MLQKIILWFLLFSLSFLGVYAANENLNGSTSNQSVSNEKLMDFNDSTQDNFVNVSGNGDTKTRNALFSIAEDMKAIVFIIATIYLIIIVIRLLFWNNTEEESDNFKKGVLWVTVGIVVTQIAFGFVASLYGSESVNGLLASRFVSYILNPLINILQTATSFLFIAIAIYSFYKMVTANGKDEAVSSAKNSIIYAIIGFILIRFAKTIVETTYWKINNTCSASNIITYSTWDCLDPAQLSGFAQMITTIINWANGLIGIVVIIMIIYAGAQVLLSAWDEDKLKKAKFSILFIAIGLLLLFMNYLILTFFIIPESVIE